MSESGLAELLHHAAPDAATLAVDDEVITEVWTRGRRRRRRARTARGAMVVLAALVVVGSALALTARGQDHDGARLAIGTGPGTTESDAGGAGLTEPTAGDNAPGATAIGSMRIPAIGLDTPMFAGDGDVAALRGGPVLLTATASPGQPGDAVVMGHRTTYSAPFLRLDELNPGDRIEVRIGSDELTYEVAGQSPDGPGLPPLGHRIVTPGDGPYGIPASMLGAPNETPGSFLTLVTYNPKYSAAQRLVVDAVLVPG